MGNLYFTGKKICIHSRFSNMCQNITVMIFYVSIPEQTIKEQFHWQMLTIKMGLAAHEFDSYIVLTVLEDSS